MLIFTCAVFFSLGSTNANACWCRKVTADTDTEEHFRNTVERLVIIPICFFGKTSRGKHGQLTFEAENVWKGDFKGRITFASPHNVSKDGKQGVFLRFLRFRFELGKNYLVYADATLAGLWVGKCGRTNFIDKAQRDIDELNRRKEK